MKKKEITHIRGWLLFFVIMVIVMATTISVFFCLAASRVIHSEIAGELVPNTNLPVDHSSNLVSKKLYFILIWILFGEFVSLSVLGYVGYRILTRKIESPVHIILNALNQFSRGQLSETINIEEPEEFHQIGSGINELAVNLQELLLYVWTQTGQCLSLIECIQSNPGLRFNRRLTMESLGQLKQLSECMEELRELAKSYVFYDVILDGYKTQAISEPGTLLEPDAYAETKLG